MKLKNLLLLFFAAMMSIPSTAQFAQNNAQTYYKKFKEFFKDDICTELKSEYAEMTDAAFKEVLEQDGTPKELMEIAMKIKRDEWSEFEKSFRVAEYKPCSNPNDWANYLKTMKYSQLSSPTGISANKDTLLIFVGSELTNDIRITLHHVTDNLPLGLVNTELFKGLNFVKVSDSDNYKTFFIEYNVDTDTTASSKKLSDYPTIPIHIEGGEAFGYFDVNRHNDEDWRNMLKSNSHYIQVKGNRVLYHMKRSCFASVCPNTITDAIGWWDQCVSWQHELMDVEKYYDRWNNLLMARDGDGGNMTATDYYTHFPDHTLGNILPWDVVYDSPGQMWGPAHEIGHVNQGNINIASCTEVSNNLFSNIHLFRTGKTTTRGRGVDVCAEDFINRTPFPLRSDVFSKSRMYLQLYLYFHAAGKDNTFYQRLFEALRQDPLSKGEQQGYTYYTNGNEDQLRFAEKCCEVAQMDLSEFFEAWGFFEPMQEAKIEDYSNYFVTLTKEDIEASRARMQKYEKKGGHLMFIEDRIKPSKRTDGVAGNRLDYSDESPVGKMGDVGQWEDYIDESVKAEGYYYSISGKWIKIFESENAKGALGFKAYDAATGKFITFGNSKEIQIPTEYIERDLKIVAAQADGTDYEIPNIEDSDNEEMLYMALSNVLSSLLKYTVYITNDGNKIGYYYPDAVQDICEIYKEAEKAYNKKDTSKHTYREWITLLREAEKEIKENPNAMATINNKNVYKLNNMGYLGYYMHNDKMGIKGIHSNSIDNWDEAYWTFEEADNHGYFYIKNKNGKYLNDIVLNLGAMCNGELRNEGIVFKINYHNNATVYFTTKDDGMYLGMNSENMIVGTNVLSDNTLWIITKTGELTAIEDVKEENVDNEIYDLHGRKVTDPDKGIYIKNGKKFIQQ